MTSQDNTGINIIQGQEVECLLWSLACKLSPSFLSISIAVFRQKIIPWILRGILGRHWCEHTR